MKGKGRSVETTITTGDISDSLAHSAKNHPRVAIDIETSGLDWTSDEIATVQIFFPESGCVNLVRVSQSTIPQNLIELIQNGDVEKIFHHALFDLRFISSKWGAQPQNIACTKIASKLLWPDKNSDSHSLQALAQSLVGVSLDKTLQVSDWFSTEISSSQIEYAVRDVLHLPAILDKLRIHIREELLTEPLARSFEYIPTRLSTDLRFCGDLFGY